MADPPQTPVGKGISSGSGAWTENSTPTPGQTSPQHPFRTRDGPSTRSLAQTVSPGLNPTRYNLSLAPDGTPAPDAYSARAIMDITAELANSMGMPLQKVTHPWQVIDYVVGNGTDDEIAARITSMADMLDRQYRKIDILTEYADRGLRDSRVFQRIYNTYATVRQAVNPIQTRVSSAKKARERMNGVIAKLQAYVGTEYFNYWFHNSMTPTLADYFLKALRKAYGSNISFTDVHRGFDQARRDRLLTRGKGVRSSVELLPSDIWNWYTGKYSNTPVSSKDATAISTRGQGLPREHHSLALSSSGYLQKPNTPLPKHKKIEVTGDETIYNKNGSALNRETVQKDVDKKIRDILSDKSPDNTTKQASPDQTQKPRRSSRRTADSGSPQGKGISPDSLHRDEASPVPTYAKETSPGAEEDDEHFRVEGDYLSDDSYGTSPETIRLTKTKRRARNGAGLLDISSSLSDTRDAGIRPLKESWDDIFKDIARGPTATPYTESATELAHRLFQKPSQLEDELIQWLLDGHRHMRGESSTQTKIPKSLRNVSHDDVSDAVTRVVTAVKTNQPTGGAHPVMKHTEWPQSEFLAVETMARTLRLAEARQDPPWMIYARSLINDTLSRFPDQIHIHQEIGRTFHGEAVRLQPHHLSEQHWFVSEFHPGRYMGWLDDEDVRVAIQFLTRNDSMAQRVDSTRIVWFEDSVQKWDANPIAANTPLDLRIATQSHRPIVYIPMHVGGDHWILTILDLSARRYEIFNSIEGGMADIKEEVTYDDIAIRTVRDIIETELVENFAKWTRGTLRSQQQQNSADCGFWVAANAAAYASRRQAAGPQETGDLRLWLISILCTALNNVAPVQGNTAVPMRWVDEAQQHAIPQSTTVPTATVPPPTTPKSIETSKATDQTKPLEKIEATKDTDVEMKDADIVADIKGLSEQLRKDVNEVEDASKPASTEKTPLKDVDDVAGAPKSVSAEKTPPAGVDESTEAPKSESTEKTPTTGTEDPHRTLKSIPKTRKSGRLQKRRRDDYSIPSSDEEHAKKKKTVKWSDQEPSKKTSTKKSSSKKTPPKKDKTSEDS